MSEPGKGTVVVLGVTSAIARALAGEYAAEGYDLVVAGRDLEEVSRIAQDLRVRHGRDATPLGFDATDFESHADFLGACIDASSVGIEGVVVAFGYMAEQADAQADFGEARRTIDATYTGAVSILGHFADHLEGRGRGFVCVISSVAGDRGRQSNYIYGSAKAGLTAFCSGLRSRLFKAGVRLTTVKPGFVDTRMTFGRPGLFLVASPEAAARAIHRAVARGKEEVYVPGFWWAIMTIICAIPEAIFKRLKL